MPATDEPVRTRLRRDAERNRQRIVEATRLLVDEQGLHVSHDQIARAAEVGVGTVYRRFPTLDALFEEIFRDRVDIVIDLLERANAVADPWEGFYLFMVGNCELRARNRGLDDFMLGRSGPLDYSRKAHTRLVPQVTRLVDRARAAGMVRPEIGQADVAIVFALIGTLMDASREVDAHLWRRYLTLLLNGMRPGTLSETLPASPPQPDDLHAILTGRPRWRPAEV